MIRIALIAVLVACGSSQHPDSGGGGGSATAGSGSAVEPAVHDTRTEIEKRRDSGCEALQPKLTECAVEDAKKTLTKKQIDELKPDELRAKHKEVFLKQCKGSAMSSRQVRVLEVCYKSETECDPLAECLKHLAPENTEK